MARLGSGHAPVQSRSESLRRVRNRLEFGIDETGPLAAAGYVDMAQAQIVVDRQLPRINFLNGRYLGKVSYMFRRGRHGGTLPGAARASVFRR